MCERRCKSSAPNASVDVMALPSDAAGRKFGGAGVKARLPARAAGWSFSEPVTGLHVCK